MLLKTEVGMSCMSIAAIVMCLFLVFSGCTPTDNPNAIETHTITPKDMEQPVATDGLEKAMDWFKRELSTNFEAVECQVSGEYAVVLAKDLIPGAEGAYGAVQVFVLKPEAGSYTIVARKEAGDLTLSYGFSAGVLTTDDLTIIFGDVGSVRYDLHAESMVDVAFSEAAVQFADGTETAIELTSNFPYMLVLEGGAEVSDIVYKTEENNIKYSDCYKENLMENSGTDVFELP